jgi:hypothetical protein
MCQLVVAILVHPCFVFLYACSSFLFFWGGVIVYKKQLNLNYSIVQIAPRINSGPKELSNFKFVLY